MSKDAAAAAAANAERHLPIDIHYNKLLDWLIDRKWTPKDAAKRLLQLHQRRDAILASVRAAVPDAPIPAYPSSYSLRALFEALAQRTGINEKNMFGQYTAQFMKDLQQLVKDYEANNMHLADAASMLVHDVDFEIPALKKKVERGMARIKDLTKQETDLQTAANSHRHEFRELCREFGIEGHNVLTELQGRRSALQDVWNGAIALLQAEEFQAALAHYRDFVSFLLEGQDGAKQPDLLPTLNYLNKHGDTSVHTFRTGEPMEVDNGNATAKQLSADTDNGVPVIDFGDSGAAPTIDFGDAPKIDFGDAPKIDFGDAPTIDFGDAPTIDFGDAPTIDFGDAPTIDFGDAPTIDFGDAPTIDFGDGAAAVPSSGSASGGPVIRESVLQHMPTRNLVLDELAELSTFLAHRCQDLRAEADITSINLYQTAPTAVQNITANKAEAHLQAVQAAEALLTSDKTRQLILMYSSPRYLQRLADSFQQKLNLADKALLRMSTINDQRELTRREVQEAGPQLDSLRQAVKDLQRKVEKSISELYDGRPGHLIGEINAV